MIEIVVSVSIRKDGNNFLTPLSTELLHEIKRNGTLRGAARKLDISYQHCWTLIDEMNRVAPAPLVVKQRGGTYGGGTIVSEFGEKMIIEYEMIRRQINQIINQMNTEINF